MYLGMKLILLAKEISLLSF